MSCTAELAGASDIDTKCKNHEVLLYLTGGSVRTAAVRKKRDTGASGIQSGSISDAGRGQKGILINASVCVVLGGGQKGILINASV